MEPARQVDLLGSSHNKILGGEGATLLGDTEEVQPQQGAEPFPLEQAELGETEVKTVAIVVELPLPKRSDEALITVKALDALMYKAAPGSASNSTSWVVDILKVEPDAGMAQTKKGTVRRTVQVTVRCVEVVRHGLIVATVVASPHDTFVRAKVGTAGTEVLLQCNATDQFQNGAKNLCAIEPTRFVVFQTRNRPSAGKWIRRTVGDSKTVMLTFIPEEGTREAKQIRRFLPQTGAKRKR